MSVRVIPARGKKGGWDCDIRLNWPGGGRDRVRVKSPLPGKDPSKRWGEARERALYAEGREAFRGARDAKVQSVCTSVQVPTFGVFWPRVVTDHYRANRKKASTTDAAESIYKNHLRRFDEKRLDEITTADVQGLKGALSAKGPKTVNNVLSVLSRALRCAVEWDVIPLVPCKFGLLKAPESARDWYELPEYRRLVDAAEKIGSLDLVVVLLGGSAGLRRGEIRALRWCDVDLGRKQMSVVKAVWRSVEDTPKGNRGRVVPLTDELVAALRAHRGLGERVLGADLSNRQIRNVMERVQRRAGVEVNGGIHLLRHTFCSHLAIAGVPAKAIQELAGHADLKTSMRYMHLSPGNKRDAVSTLEKFYEAVEATEKAVRAG